MKTRLSALVLAVVLSQSTGSAQQLLWKYVYDGSAHSSDEAWPMALGADQNLYAAGWSAGLGTGLDFTIASVTLSGAERWLYRYNGPANRDDAAHAIALGQDGNVYAAGVSTGSGGSDDLTIVGLDPNGLERWVYRYDGPAHGQDEACSLVLGSDGCLYAGGCSQGVGTGTDFTVVSVDTTGAERWVYRYDGPVHRDDNDSARLIAYGADGNVYAAGWSEGTSSGPDFTVVSLTGSGQERWVYRYDGPGSGRDAAWGVVWGTDGNVCAAGYTTGSGTDFDLTAISLTPAGQERWVYRKATTGRDQAWGIAAGPGGMVYAGGELRHESGSDFVVVAIDSGGQEHWVYRYDGPAGGNDYVGPVHVGRDGNIYAAGKSYGGATGFDLVAACLDTSGRQRWLYRYNGPGNGWDNGETIIYGPDGNTYVAGSITGLGTGQDFAIVGIGRKVQQDVGVACILSPTGVVDSGSKLVPSAVVRDFGTSNATFPVTMVIGGSYNQTISETLAAGITDTVSFPVWTAVPTGILPVTCFTALVGDENPANDTIRDSVRVVGPPVHDVGAVAIVDPVGTVHTGDTVVPRARVTNFGNMSERYFDVRFRIGTSYSRTASAMQTLLPDSTVELTFKPWVAASGYWVVSCSTMLTGDANRANDKVTSTVRAFQQAALYIEPDQSDRLEVGEGKTFQFYARIDGDTGGVVEVVRPFVPAGWSLRLCDATGTNELTDTDVDGMPDLGYVAPGEQRWFSLEVLTPSGLVGDTASLTERTFVVAGHLGNDSAVADTALLNLTIVPGFSVHNFPNPFSIRTAFVIGLPGDGKVSLTVYTRSGARVCRVLDREPRAAGVRVVRWEAVNDHGQDVGPGTYEYVLDYVHQGTTDRIRKRLVVARE